MKYIGLICFIYLLVIGMFYPTFATALIKTNNATFNGNINGWTTTNGSGTNTCSNNNSGSDTNFNSVFAYSSNLISQTAFRAEGSVIGLLVPISANRRGMIHQQLTISGSGLVNIQGSFSYYGVETSLLGLLGSNSSWIRLDIYDSSNTTFVANLGCVSFTSDTNWTTTTPVHATLPAGTTYTIRATLRTQINSNALTTRIVNLGIDNINIHVSPISLELEQTGEDIHLDWVASTQGTGAPAIHTSEPYEIARKTSSGLSVSDIITTTNTNSYIDTSTSPNTTYWYAIFDKDTNNTRSPISTEVSILTKPDSPQNLHLNPLDEEKIEITWDTPVGGAESYVVQRAPDEDGSPGTYINIETNTTENSHIDDGHMCGDTYWYRVIAVNSSGSSSPSNAIQGSTLYCISIILTTDGMVDFGFMPLNSTQDSTTDGIHDEEIIQPVYGAVNLNIKSDGFTDGIYSWIFGNESDTDQIKFEFSHNSTDWTTFSVSDQYYTFEENVFPPNTSSLFLRLTTPTESESMGPYNSNITIQASRP